MWLAICLSYGKWRTYGYAHKSRQKVHQDSRRIYEYYSSGVKTDVTRIVIDGDSGKLHSIKVTKLDHATYRYDGYVIYKSGWRRCPLPSSQPKVTASEHFQHSPSDHEIGAYQSRTLPFLLATKTTENYWRNGKLAKSTIQALRLWNHRWNDCPPGSRAVRLINPI